MGRNAGAPKTESLSFRIDADLKDRLDKAISEGRFSSRSEIAVRALAEFFERERQDDHLRDRVLNLIKYDPDIRAVLLDLTKQPPKTP